MNAVESSVSADDARLRRLVKEVARVFNDVDRATQDFAEKTNLKCASGCFECCQNPHVEASVLEMLPMALQILKTSSADDVEAWLSSSQSDGDLCPHLRSGRCAHYDHRPLICRLFGYSADKDKYGDARLISCLRIKVQITDSSRIDSAPSCEQFARRLYELDPSLASNRRSIRDSLRSALEFLLWEERLASGVT